MKTILASARVRALDASAVARQVATGIAGAPLDRSADAGDRIVPMLGRAANGTLGIGAAAMAA